MIHYYVIDTETTGLKAGYHEIIQISALRCNPKFQKTANIKADYPNRASKEALDITGKTIFDLKTGIDKREAVELFDEFFEEDKSSPEHRCIVAHNAQFDRRMLHALWLSVNRKFPANLWLCTKEFSRKFAKRAGLVKPKLSLAACLEMTGITPKLGAHNAVVDSINTESLFSKLMNENLGHVQLIKRAPHE